MGLLGGSDDDEPETPDDVGEAEADDGLDLADDPAESGDPEMLDDDAIEDTDLDASEDDPSGSDIDVEEALKELSARMSVLSSNLEGVQDSRGELEDKLGTVEERMSRLGSLAEAVSSEYNPFISENAPDEPSWTPEPEAPEDRAQPPASEPSSGDEDPADHAEETDPPEAPTDGAESSADGPAPDDEPAETPDDAGEAPEPPDPTTMPRTDPDRLENEPGAVERAMPDPTSSRDGEGTNGAQKPGDSEFEDNLLMLEWVGMMLDRVGRAGLMDLLDYYQNLGWLDTQLKDRATRIAVGVDAPDRIGDSDWRGDVELHRRSLVAIQRLQGREIPAARVDEVQLDLRRLFEG